MACTKPNKAWQRKKDGQMVFNKPRRGELFLYKPMELPCQQCLDCRLDYAADWSMRIVHESKMHERNCVVTLTYDPEHLPFRGDLGAAKPDIERFIRHLRQHHPGVTIAYAGCGEYGELGRPHFHYILHGYDFEDKTYWQRSASGSKLWKSKELDELWGLGFALVGECDKASADYVGRYAVKKVNGSRAKDHYRRVDPETGEEYFLTPEFFRCSKGRAQPGEHLPFGRGIGARFLEKYFSDVFPRDQVVFAGGAHRRPPRYYTKLLKRRDAQMHEAVKAKREADAQRPERLAEATPERRSVRDECSRAKVAFKKRQLR